MSKYHPIISRRDLEDGHAADDGHHATDEMTYAPPSLVDSPEQFSPIHDSASGSNSSSAAEAPLSSSNFTQPFVSSVSPHQSSPAINAAASGFVPSVGPIGGDSGAGTYPIAYASPPPPNRWRDSICDWPSNLFPSCWCACCCCYGMYLNAQIAQKTGYAPFQTVINTFLGIWIFSVLLELILGGGLIMWIPLLSALIFSIKLRLHIVEKQKITECGSSPMVSECCCGFWCWYCSVAQMARHVYGYTRVLDGDALPDRPDSYLPAHPSSHPPSHPPSYPLANSPVYAPHLGVPAPMRQQQPAGQQVQYVQPGAVNMPIGGSSYGVNHHGGTLATPTTGVTFLQQGMSTGTSAEHGGNPVATYAHATPGSSTHTYASADV